MTDFDVKEKTQEILGSYPNTYTFTKSLAEMMFKKNRGSVPAIIYRPSIITCSLKEPVPGWIDSFAAAGQMTITCGMGFVSHLFTNNMNTISDMIPVDMVVNSIIVAAYSKADKNQLTVMNYGTSHKNPMLWKEYHRLNIENLQ
jgi:hypothetical protein